MRRFGRLSASALPPILSFVVALVVAGVGGCNLHEAGHLLVGKLMDVPVEAIEWCIPANGRITFAYQEPALVGYAGGIPTALALAAVHWWVVRPRLASPVWWAAGVAVAGTAVSQFVVGVWEGTSPLTYGAALDDGAGLAVLALAPLVGAAVVQWALAPPSPRPRPEAVTTPGRRAGGGRGGGRGRPPTGGGPDGRSR
jgi:hypothetical protein